MDDDAIDYSSFMDRAFRRVIASALAHAAEHGLPGDHHFYITIRTDHPGVEIPDWLREQHPVSLSIILQHEFDGLEVDEESFSVRLSFHNRSVRIRIPLEAIDIFADPAVQFGLRFTHPEEEAEAEAEPPLHKTAPSVEALEGTNVVQLDAFRH